jgi:hypothetical protein
METNGKQMQGGNAEARREAARALGSARTPAKSEAAKLRNESRKGVPLAPEIREKMRQAQLSRWEAIRAERQAQGLDAEPATEKRPPGRPRKAMSEEAVAPKRPRGRPKKTDAQSNTPTG